MDQLTLEQLDLLRDLLMSKRESLNRTAELLLEDIERIDKLLLKLEPSLCPNCGEVGYHAEPEECV